MSVDVPLRTRNRTQLVATVTSKHLGFKPSAIWCVSPSRQHRTEPYALPQPIVLGCVESRESRAKFTPPPFAVEIEGDGQRALIAVKAEAGWHRWNIVTFDATKRQVNVIIELEGHTPPAKAKGHVKVQVFGGKANESRHQLLARGLKAQYPAAFREPAEQPKWWNTPIYCGVGDQAANWIRYRDEAAGLTFDGACNQKLYTRSMDRLVEADMPIGIITIDAGWSLGDTWEVDRERWPDLRGFIEDQHEAGRKVLLWLATWFARGLPEQWCVFEDGKKISVDPTNPEYRRSIRDRIAYMLSDEQHCLNADGFKIDQLRRGPREVDFQDQGPSANGYHLKKKPKFKLHSDVWGTELLKQYQTDIYRAAKAIKADALINSSTVNSYFGDTFDQVRLHDIEYMKADCFAAMKARADLSRAALPHHSVDADNWLHTDYAKWLDYTMRSPALGVPCTFYSEHFVSDLSEKTIPIPMKDLRRIGRAWRKAGY